MSNISVVLMVYNRKEFYKEALDSLKEQTDKDFDLVIVSNIDIEYDLSVFKKVNIIPAPADSHEEYVDGKVPSNLLESYISGMEATKNNIVAFLEDDDKFVPTKISVLRSANIQGYYHNDYYDFGSKEPHNNGKGFNYSCIAVNKSAYNGIMELSQQHPSINYMPDSMIYWYAIEHNIPVVIDNGKLTYYRHKPYQKMYANLADTLHKQMAALEEASKTFKSPEVHEIIREVSIQNQIYLNSLGHYKKISINDMIWLMKRPVTGKKGKIVSYFLSLPLWHGIGVKWMGRIRVQREVQK